MTYIVKKKRGNRFYNYEVKSIREGKRVIQKTIKYLGPADFDRRKLPVVNFGLKRPPYVPAEAMNDSIMDLDHKSRTAKPLSKKDKDYKILKYYVSNDLWLEDAGEHKKDLVDIVSKEYKGILQKGKISFLGVFKNLEWDSEGKNSNGYFNRATKEVMLEGDFFTEKITKEERQRLTRHELAHAVMDQKGDKYYEKWSSLFHDSLADIGGLSFPRDYSKTDAREYMADHVAYYLQFGKRNDYKKEQKLIEATGFRYKGKKLWRS